MRRPRAQRSSVPECRTAARSITKLAPPRESVERCCPGIPSSALAGRSQSASAGIGLLKESLRATTRASGPVSPGVMVTRSGRNSATVGWAGPTPSSTAGLPGSSAPEPVTTSKWYVATVRPAGTRNTARPLSSVLASASRGDPPGIRELPRSTSARPACRNLPRLTRTSTTASVPAAATTGAADGTTLTASSARAARGAGGAALVVHAPTLLSTSTSAPRVRRSDQSRSVGRKARQFRRIRSATSPLWISGLASKRTRSLLCRGSTPWVAALPAAPNMKSATNAAGARTRCAHAQRSARPPLIGSGARAR